MNHLFTKGSHKFAWLRMASTFTNRLANEKSPYLLRHKHNLVDWYPWGSEAFTKARELNRPIFMSVGYSTCHWCYVMERESFENPDIAKILNDNFISILVDREERPDVDKFYMNFVLALMGSGGWPMSVFMDPDLVPFTGGSYFPPQDDKTTKQMGFPNVLRTIMNMWRNDPKMLTEQGLYMRKAMVIPHTRVRKNTAVPASFELILKVIEHLYGRFDEKEGGFDGGPKFPQASLYQVCNKLLGWMGAEPSDLKNKVAVMIDKSLEAMALGGIRDHIDGGFHRYTVDGKWQIPHFEKMLYDQGQLLAVYSDFSLLTKGKYNYILEEEIRYLKSILLHKEGGFYSAEDAVSLTTIDAKSESEGAFYVWEQSEINSALKGYDGVEGFSASEIFSKYFNVNPNGNVEKRYDHRNELALKNVLHMRDTHEQLADQLNIPAYTLANYIDEYKGIISKIRSIRPRAYVDTKIVASYQGLMISGLAKAAQALQTTEALVLAEECAAFCKKYFERDEGPIIRCVYKKEDGTIEYSNSLVYGFSHDYAYLIQGLLDLYSVNGDEDLLLRAKKLQETMIERLWDAKESEEGFIMCEDAISGLTDFFKEESDGAEPAPNPMAASNLIRLGTIFNDESFLDYAKKITKGVCRIVAVAIQVCPTAVIPNMYLDSSSTKIVIAGPSDNALVLKFRELLNSHYVWNGVVVHIQGNSDLCKVSPVYEEMAKNTRPAVYICSGDTCGLPIYSESELLEKLSEISGHITEADLDRSYLNTSEKEKK